MGEPFLGEVKLFAFNYVPQGWAFCNGQFLPINQNQALFSLLGTQYGGNGQTTFALPDFRGRVPIHMGAGFVIGQAGGEQAHTLTLSELPQHAHAAFATGDNATTGVPTNALLARATNNIHEAPNNLVALNAASLTNVGGSQAHLNMQPFLTLSFAIALVGIFPSQN